MVNTFITTPVNVRVGMFPSTQTTGKEHRMNKSMTAVAVMAIFALSRAVLAQATPRIDQRQENQEKRIEHGLKSCELTKKEAARVAKGQAKVHEMADNAAADGQVTMKDKAH